MATTVERTEKGASLARGPALILGTILEVAGLYFLYKQHTFPPLSNFPNGDAPVAGKVFFGIFGVNGWTGLFTAACGGLLLFGAAQHLLAKTMSLIVGVALGAAAVIAVISGNVLGLAAANGWTRLGWGVCAVILLFNTMVPRRTRTVTEPVPADDRGDGAGRAGAVAPRRRAVADDQATRVDEPATRRMADDEPIAGTTTDRSARARDDEASEPLVAHDRGVADDGVEHRGVADRGVEDRGVDDRGVDDRGVDDGVADDRTGADEAPTRMQRAGPLDDRETTDGADETSADTSRREPRPE